MAEQFRSLYHYTALLHLPSILSEGLTQGTAADCPVFGPNFTTSPNPHAQTWVRGSCLNKTEARLTVMVPDDKLHRQVDLWKRHRISRNHRRMLDPHGQGKFWYVYEGVIPPDNIRSVEVMGSGGYRITEGRELAELCDLIEAEARKLTFVDLGDGTSGVKGADSWLLSLNPEAIE